MGQGRCAGPQLLAMPARRALLLSRPARNLCTGGEPPRVPRAFEAFFPRRANKQGEKGESKASETKGKAEGATSLFGSGGGGGSGGSGGNGGPNSDLLQPQLLLLTGAATALALFNAMTSEGGDGKRAEEISMQHFLSNILAHGHVVRLVVVNNTLVKVHMSSQHTS